MRILIKVRVYIIDNITVSVCILLWLRFRVRVKVNIRVWFRIIVSIRVYIIDRIMVRFINIIKETYQSLLPNSLKIKYLRKYNTKSIQSSCFCSKNLHT